VFKPKIHDEVYSFDDLPRAFDEMEAGKHTGIPVVRVAEEPPAGVAGIA
jgi:hypothetical protein